MNFEAEDIERSLRRWLAAVTGQLDDLGNEWSIRNEEAQVADDERPVATIVSVDEATPRFIRSAIPQGDVNMAQPYVVTAYPAYADDDGPLSPELAHRRARELRTTLHRAVIVGLVDDDGALLSWPMAIPVYDYAAVGLGEPGPVEPYGAIEVDDAAARAIPDPIDDRRWTVTLALRLSWWEGGRLRRDAAEAPVVQGIPGTYQP